MRNALVDHMVQNNLFAPEQHGFLTGKSCTTQLLEYMVDITQAIDNGDDLTLYILISVRRLTGYRIPGFYANYTAMV